MVGAGVVRHPCEGLHGGYNEIQNPKQRYSLTNRQKLSASLVLKIMIGYQNIIAIG